MVILLGKQAADLDEMFSQQHQKYIYKPQNVTKVNVKFFN